MIKVKCNYPPNMDSLKKIASKIMADILVKKLSWSEIDKLIEVLEHDPEYVKL